MARILCIETATHLCSVALTDAGRVLATRDEEERDRYIHAERLNVLVEEVMNEAGSLLRDLNAVAVGTGPGSYTGLRIGLSAAKGFCYALEIPIIGIGTLDTLVQEFRSAHDTEASGNLMPMVDARRMEVFTRSPYRTGISPGAFHPLVLDEAWLADVTDPVIVFGDGADKAAALWKSHGGITHVPHIRPRARAMAGMASERYAKKMFDDLAYLVPQYGKEANLTQPARRPAG